MYFTRSLRYNTKVTVCLFTFQPIAAAASCPPPPLGPPRYMLATDDDDEDVEGGSVGSGGSVTDSGRGASEEGDSGSTATHGLPVNAFAVDKRNGDCRRQPRAVDKTPEGRYRC